MIKLNKRYRLKIIHVYTKTASYEDEAVVNFYEDIESAMNKRTSQFEIAMGDFNRKVGAKKVGEKSVGNFGVGTRNCRCNTPVEFAERNTHNLLHTFFQKRESRKWTRKSPEGITKTRN